MKAFLLNLLTGPSGTDQRIANHLAVWGGLVGVVVWVTSWVMFQWFGGKLVEMGGYAAYLSSAIATIGAAEAAADYTYRKQQ